MPIDYLEDDNGDLLIHDGELVRGDATQKHIKDLLISQKGDWKQHPGTGVGLQDYIEDDDSGAAYVEIQSQLEDDGCTVNKLELYENGAMTLDAEYEDTDQ